MLSRLPWIKAVFNLGQMMVSVVVGLTVFPLVDDGSPGEISVRAVLAAIVAALAMSAISQALVSLVIWTSEGCRSGRTSAAVADCDSCNG